VIVNRTCLFLVGIILLAPCAAVRADLASEFSGFTCVNEIGVSGLQSDNGTTKLPGSMFTLGPDLVSYPYGIGTVPSPGGALGSHFDQGLLGVKLEGSTLIVKLAATLDPEAGYYYSGWSSRYGQGDIFLTVDDSAAGVKNFALLSYWAKDALGDYLHLGRSGETCYNQAQQFHDGKEGYLVSLSSADNIVLTSGAGAYTPSYSVNGLPQGLDYRVFAQGGTDIGNANLLSDSLVDGRTWYIQTWTLPWNWLSTDLSFALGLHSAVSCSNDQIGLVTEIVTPVPPAFVLGLIGFGTAGLAGRIGRRKAKKSLCQAGNA
jgi:hypothetical protein